jgi:hypothetical protein
MRSPALVALLAVTVAGCSSPFAPAVWVCTPAQYDASYGTLLHGAVHGRDGRPIEVTAEVSLTDENGTSSRTGTGGSLADRHCFLLSVHAAGRYEVKATTVVDGLVGSTFVDIVNGTVNRVVVTVG